MGGDELAAKSADPVALGAYLRTAQRVLADYRSPVYSVGKGAMVAQEGLHFIFGIGTSWAEADSVELPKVKSNDPRGVDDGTADGRTAKHWYERRVLRFSDRAAFDAARPGWAPSAAEALQPRGVLEALQGGEEGGHRGVDAPGGRGGSVLEGSLGKGQEDVAGAAAEAEGLGDLGSGAEVLPPGTPRFEHPGAAVPKGGVDIFREAGRKVFGVFLTKGHANFATFLHETGHIGLELLGDFAAREDAPQQIKDDWAKALAWLGVERREQIRREHHEKWARGWEAYLLEGKAPSLDLVRPFARIRAWLLSIYKDVKNLRVELDPEIRGVFDRMLATDEQIARTSAAMGLAPLFRSPEEAGMSGEQWERYLAHRQHAAETLQRRINMTVLKDRKRELEQWWTAERAEEEAAAKKEHADLPAVRARRLIFNAELPAGGKMDLRLNRAEVVSAVGAERARSFHARMRADGMSPGEVAMMFGYASGKELLDAVLDVPERAEWAAREADRRMAEKHPAIFQDLERLEDEVAKGLHGDFTADWLHEEAELLYLKAQREGAPLPPAESFKRAARELADKKKVGELQPGRVMQAERLAGERAFREAARGNYAAAYIAKQQQILNHYLWLFVRELREEMDSARNWLYARDTDSYRSDLGRADVAIQDASGSEAPGPLLAAHDAILGALGILEDVDPKQGEAALYALESLLGSENTDLRFDAELVRDFVRHPRSWRELVPDEVRKPEGCGRPDPRRGGFAKRGRPGRGARGTHRGDRQDRHRDGGSARPGQGAGGPRAGVDAQAALRLGPRRGWRADRS